MTIAEKGGKRYPFQNLYFADIPIYFVMVLSIHEVTMYKYVSINILIGLNKLGIYNQSQYTLKIWRWSNSGQPNSSHNKVVFIPTLYNIHIHTI